MILVAVISFGVSAFADNYYQVTVGTTKTLHYFDENGNEIGTTTVVGIPQVINVCAKSEYDAEVKAIEECATMCKRSYLKSEPKASYQGKLCTVKSTLEPASCRGTLQKGSC